jgi:hypothetical protein
MGLSTLSARILDDDEAHNIMVGALSALLAATPERMFVVDRAMMLKPGTRVLVEVLSNNTIRFSLDDGARQ